MVVNMKIVFELLNLCHEIANVLAFITGLCYFEEMGEKFAINIVLF